MQLIPTKDFVLAQKADTEKSRLVLPDNHDPVKEGDKLVIVALGPEVKEARIGDGLIVGGPQAVLRVPHEGVDYFIVKEQNILALTRE